MSAFRRLTVTAETKPDDDRTGTFTRGTLCNVQVKTPSGLWEEVRNSGGRFSATVEVVEEQVETVRERILENLREGGITTMEAVIT